MLQKDSEKKRVTRSIAELGFRVTAADVSTKTGLPVLIAAQSLNQIAFETGGHLAVSQGGDIVYSFSPVFANAYLATGLKRICQKILETIFEILFLLLKISFGIMLIVSFAIVVVTFFVLFFSQKGKDSRRNSPDIGSQFNSYLNYMILGDLFFHFSRQKPKASAYHYDCPTQHKREQGNFLFDCYSFLFGDGNPNEGLDEKRWQLIAKVIRYHDYVVTSEQLAPYTGAAPGNQDAVLPVLVRFGGKPEVTESGNIVYRFAELATSAGAERAEPPPSFLREFHWKFSELTEKELKPIYLIAFLNLSGSWFLYLLLHSSSAPSITALFTTLVIYGSLFLLVPLIRFYAIGHLNKHIDERNGVRAEYADDLRSPQPELKSKLKEAREFRLRNKTIAESSIIYTTEKHVLDPGQQDDLEGSFKADSTEAETFDARPEETFDARPGT